MNAIRRFAGVVGAGLLVSGCLLTTDVNDLLDDIERRQHAIIVGSSLPQVVGMDEAPKIPDAADVDEAEEKVRAFIEQYPDEKNTISPLLVRLGILHTLAGNEVRASLAFDDAEKAGGDLSSTVMAYRDLGGDLYWWFSKQSINWDPEKGDFQRADDVITALGMRIDNLSGGETDGDNRETLMWLHNVRFRMMAALTRQQSGVENDEKEPMTRLNPAVLKGYLDFWEKNGVTLKDAKLLAIDFGQVITVKNVPTCKKPKDIEKLTIKGSDLQDTANRRWSIQVFCNVSILMTLYHKNVASRYPAVSLDDSVKGRDWIRCDLNKPTKEVTCKPVSQ